MKIIVNTAACVGHARCNIVAPELFPLDASGYNTVATTVEVPAGLESLARRSVRACPERVLTIVEDSAASSADA
ncbi:ferredoxin [Paraburkholderia dinghuensis]|uniref:Ferredoxin n=1 Tax=Paraburkholderia dinghuensis TaxID=2305225 RepID=A0A3N6PSL0_9BURK|nr:ferredoxin [Paraburkholderia dinghuensis]RQH04970.1 ferredoxin [Paraburkholderia dinghuensis]